MASYYAYVGATPTWTFSKNQLYIHFVFVIRCGFHCVLFDVFVYYPQVPRQHMVDYSLHLLYELFQPLHAIHTGAIEGRGAICTTLLCETLLSFLPSMTFKDQPYEMLRDYKIALMVSGVIGRERHLNLNGIAQLRSGVLFLPYSTVHKVFIPLHSLPADARREAVRMVAFLKEMKTNDRKVMATKAAAVLVDQFIEELIETQVISCSKTLKTPYSLIKAGVSVHSTVSTILYVEKAFNPELLPSECKLKSCHRANNFLRTASCHCNCPQEKMCVRSETNCPRVNP